MISRYGILLGGLILVDGLSSAIWFGGGIAEESNPIMRRVLENFGIAGFLVAKVSTLINVWVIEFALKRKLLPDSIIRRYYVFAITAFIVVYAGCFIFAHF